MNNIRCPNCGSLLDDHLFCFSCGARYIPSTYGYNGLWDTRYLYEEEEPSEKVPKITNTA
jgi:hypothetical protein